jgi:hypothetical protein
MMNIFVMDILWRCQYVDSIASTGRMINERLIGKDLELNSHGLTKYYPVA